MKLATRISLCLLAAVLIYAGWAFVNATWDIQSWPRASRSTALVGWYVNVAVIIHVTSGRPKK